MLGNRLFLSDIYLFIHATKQTVCLKSYYALHTTEDRDMHKVSCPEVVYSVLCRNYAYTFVNNIRQNMCVSLYLPQSVLNVLVRTLLTYQWQKPNFDLSKKGIIY